MSDLGTIAILFNQLAGRHRAQQMAASIADALKSRQISYEIFGDRWPGNVSGFRSVWIIGGDGTLNYFLNHVAGEVPPIAMFKAGTGNDFAQLLYGDASLEDTIERALSASPRKVDVGVCNGQFFVNVAGIGFDGEVVKHMNAIRWMGAFWGYYAAVIKVIMGFKEPVYNISIDEGPIHTQHLLLLLVSNAPSTGGGFRISPRADVEDGQLNLVTAKSLGRLKRLWALPKVRKGQHLDLSFIHHQPLRKISIRADREVKAQLDGEMISGRQFDIEIYPAKFQFLY
jgi:diacylglycerol kinase (ATP)